MSDDPRTRETTSTVDRRTVVRTAAWTVPVIAASAQAPAFAASCNQLYQGVLSPESNYTYVRPRYAYADIALTSPGGTVHLDINSVFTTYTPRPTNLTVLAPLPNGTYSTGGIPQAGIEFGNAMDGSQANNIANNQTITFTFSRTVYNLVFTLTDFDNSANHRDVASISGPAFTYTFPGSSQVNGSGTDADPFRVGGGTVNYDNQLDGTGNVRIAMGSSTVGVNSFSIKYWNTKNTATGNNVTQSIFLTRMNFDAYADGCL